MDGQIEFGLPEGVTLTCGLALSGRKIRCFVVESHTKLVRSMYIDSTSALLHGESLYM